jgi:hypothetical protein
MKENNDKSGGISRRNIIASLGAAAITPKLVADSFAQEVRQNEQVDLTSLLSVAEPVNSDELKILYKRLSDDLMANEAARSINGWQVEYPFGDLKIRATVTTGTNPILVIWVFSEKVISTNEPVDQFRGKIFSFICHPNSEVSGASVEGEFHLYRTTILNGVEFQPTRPVNLTVRPQKGVKTPDLLRANPVVTRRLLKGTIETILSRM